MRAAMMVVVALLLVPAASAQRPSFDFALEFDPVVTNLSQGEGIREIGFRAELACPLAWPDPTHRYEIVMRVASVNPRGIPAPMMDPIDLGAACFPDPATQETILLPHVKASGVIPFDFSELPQQGSFNYTITAQALRVEGIGEQPPHSVEKTVFVRFFYVASEQEQPYEEPPSEIRERSATPAESIPGPTLAAVGLALAAVALARRQH